jgi:hypothetical protein
VGASGPEDVRGFWRGFDPAAVQMGQSYASGQNAGNVQFYLLRPLPDGGYGDVEASLVNGGTVAFTAGGPDNFAGTLAGLVLTRAGQTIATVDTGSFIAARTK